MTTPIFKEQNAEVLAKLPLGEITKKSVDAFGVMKTAGRLKVARHSSSS
jgi:hypothetical protein